MSSDNGNKLEVNSTVSKYTADKVTVGNGNILGVDSAISKVNYEKVTVTVDQIIDEVIRSETIPAEVKPAIRDFIDSLTERVIYSIEEFKKIDPPHELLDIWPRVLDIVKALFSLI